MVREGLQSHCSLRSVPVFLKERQGASAANRTRHLGRFKRFPVQSDDQLLGLSRYAELNPSSAALVGRAQQRRWGSLWSRTRGKEAVKAFLSRRPVEWQANWTARVNTPSITKELGRVRVSIERGRPYGEEKWVRETVKDLGLEQTVRPEGRPWKALR